MAINMKPVRLRYVLAAALLLLTAVAVLLSAPWFEAAIVFFPALMLFLGNDRRIFRAGVSRSEQQIICRFVPGRSR